MASLISGGLYAATFAGLAIPTWAFSAGPLVGYIVYKLLPKRVEDEIDTAAKDVVDVVTTIPQEYYNDDELDPSKSDFPAQVHKGGV